MHATQENNRILKRDVRLQNLNEALVIIGTIITVVKAIVDVIGQARPGSVTLAKSIVLHTTNVFLVVAALDFFYHLRIRRSMMNWQNSLTDAIAGQMRQQTTTITEAVTIAVTTAVTDAIDRQTISLGDIIGERMREQTATLTDTIGNSIGEAMGRQMREQTATLTRNMQDQTDAITRAILAAGK